MKTITIILVIFLLNICQVFSQNVMRIDDDKTIRKIFDNSEIECLIEIIDFFDQIVLNSTSSNNLDSAYHQYLENLKYTEHPDEIYAKINPDELQKYEFFDSLESKNFFNEIWIYKSVLSVRTKDTTIENPEEFYTLEVNTNGKYVQYLKKLSKKDDLYSQVYELTMSMGDIPTTIRWGCIQNHKLYDFNKEYNRLFIAINCLSSEESIETKVEKYLNRKGSKIIK